jgi:hypothetical protein
VFCVFEDGKLSLYSDKGGYLVGEVPLAGHVTKVRVEKALVGKLPFRFTVTSTEVVRVEGRRMKLGDPRAVEFAAPSNDLMKEWANSLHLWRRMSWRDNVKFFDDSREMSHAEEREALQGNTRALKDTRARRSLAGNMSKKLPSSLKSIMHGQASPSVRKLKQMMRHPTRAAAAAASTPCTASSSA